nr:integrase, catalytic region, zinc finger, CCHC-type, peptidase aspartic, catalytic [Tanacetum cinerariifolium]
MNQTIHMIMPSKDTLYNGRKGIGIENPSYFEKGKDLRPSLYDEKIVQICLRIIDSGCSKHMTGNHALLTNFVKKFLGTVRFGNNDFAVIASYGNMDVGKLKAKGDIRVFVEYSKESAAFRIYNKRTRKIHESVNVNFDEISEMASKQFSLEPGISNLIEMGKSSNPSVSQVSETSKKDLEDFLKKFR